MHLKQFKDIEYIEHQRDVKYTRIEIKWPSQVNVIGNNKKQMTNYITKKYNWIKTKKQKLDKIYEEATIIENHIPYFGKWYSVEEFNQQSKTKIRKNLRDPLKIYSEIHAQKLGEKRQIKIKKMITKHASCNKKTIYLSQYLSMLPKELIQYVIFHEYTHMYEKSHNKKFWKIIQEKYKNYEQYEKQLAVWWGRVRKLINN